MREDGCSALRLPNRTKYRLAVDGTLLPWWDRCLDLDGLRLEWNAAGPCTEFSCNTVLPVPLIWLSCQPMQFDYAADSDRWRQTDHQPGTGMFIPTGTEMRSRGTRPRDHIILCLSATKFDEVVNTAFDGCLPTLRFQPELVTPELWSLQALIAQYMQQPDTGERLYLESLLTLIMVHTVQAAAETPKPMRGPQTLTPRQLSRVWEYVEAHLAESLSLSELAAVVGLNPYHFAKCYKQETGLAPHQYVIERRLSKARSFLAHTETPISQIALKVGFANPSHLSSVFRRQLGVTPRVYRLEHQSRVRDST